MVRARAGVKVTKKATKGVHAGTVRFRFRARARARARVRVRVGARVRV